MFYNILERLARLHAICYFMTMNFVQSNMATSKLDTVAAAVAIENALDALGHESKRALTFHLENFHGFVVGRDSSIVHLSKALSQIIGPWAAELLIERIFVELDKVAEVQSAA